MTNQNSGTVNVIKRNLKGEETWRYTGSILRRTASAVLLEAYFNRPDLPFHGLVFKQNDRFVEAYFSDRWFNIFELYDRDDASLKGWYCNVTRPAVFLDGEVSYVDLALDLLVFPGGRQLVLDEDEFQALHLDDATSRQARRALAELQEIVQPQAGFRLKDWLAA